MVVAAIIVGIVLAVGGSGGGGEDVAGLVSTTTPGETSTSTTTPATTSASTSPSTTTLPPTSTTAPPGTTTTPAGVTTTTDGGNGGGTGSSALVSQAIESGSYIEDEISFTGEIHWYSFYAEEGDAVYIVLFDSTPDGPMNPWLGLIDPDGDVVVEDDGFPGYAYVHFYYQITQTGEHTVRVRDKNLGTGPYALSFSQLSKTVQPIAPGSFQEQLAFPGQAHWYSFSAKAGDSVYIVFVDSTDGPMNPWLSLIDPTGKVIFDDDGFPGYQSVQLDLTLSETGEYLILVRDKSLIGGMYTLSFNMLVMD